MKETTKKKPCGFAQSQSSEELEFSNTTKTKGKVSKALRAAIDAVIDMDSKTQH